MISIQVGLGDILRNAILVILPKRSEAKICIKKKCPSVVNGGITMTLADGAQSSFERAGLQSSWELFRRVEEGLTKTEEPLAKLVETVIFLLRGSVINLTDASSHKWLWLLNVHSFQPAVLLICSLHIYFFFILLSFIFCLCMRAKNKTSAFCFFGSCFLVGSLGCCSCAAFRFKNLMLNTVIPSSFRVYSLLFYLSDIRQTFVLRHVTLSLDEAVLRKISPWELELH